MLATDHPTFAPHESHNYNPEDLESMRQAFMRACGENPLLSQTAAQRDILAKAVLYIYQHHFSQSELIAAALGKLRQGLGVPGSLD